MVQTKRREYLESEILRIYNIKSALLYQMGNLCDCILILQAASNKNHQPLEPPPSSDRRMITQKPSLQIIYQQNILQQPKHNQPSASQVSESLQADAKPFSQKQSTALNSNICDQKPSSIIQSYIDTSSIIIISPQSDINPSTIDSKEYYTLIDKVAFVKKTSHKLKVITPAGSSELNCPPQNIISTLFIAEGIPMEILSENICSMGQNSFVQTQNSPIRLVLKLNCLQCQKKVKLTYCKAYVSIQKLQCPKCQQIGKWGLLDIEANATIWGKGRRILDHESFESAPTEFRLLGCVMCFRFGDLRKLEDCQCYVCKNCLIPGHKTVCPICNPLGS